MSQLILSPITPELLINRIADEVTKRVLKAVTEQHTTPKHTTPENPLDEYIQKSEITGKLASGATLWKYEKQGKLTVYGVGGKRYYKRVDIENLFKPLNK